MDLAYFVEDPSKQIFANEKKSVRRVQKEKQEDLKDK
jgi:hypothetical protein